VGTLPVGTLHGAAPSKIKEPSVFYSQDFDHKPGMKYIHIETKIGVVGDEVYVGRPRVYCNDSIVLCDCGKEAVNIYFKNGEVQATCYECGPKIKPVNQVKYGNPEKKSKEINKK
jgi:hypothetical protein